MIKKIILSVALMVAAIGTKAESLQVKDVVIPQNGTVSIEIELDNPNAVYEGFTFAMQLPEGLVPVMDGEGFPLFEKGDRIATKSPQSGYTDDDNMAKFALLTNGTAISGTSGLLIAPNVRLSADAAVGTKFTVTLTEIKFTTPVPDTEELDDVTFTVTVGEPVDTRTVLDELSTTMPEAANGVDVRVKRTIKANEWSTLVLPFAMTAEQVKSAFGNDVQLADFTGYTIEEDEDENIVGIQVNSSAITAVQANRPCLIKVSTKVEEFTVDGVDISPEDEPENAVVDKRKEWSKLVGTYVAGTEVPEYCLFLNGNNFWYSTGATNMKAYRAYFDFSDVLTEVEYAEAKIRIIVNGNATAIESIGANGEEPQGVYTLQGVSLGENVDVDNLPKGVYVVNGKKVIVK
jgi:hypothetical protein